MTQSRIRVRVEGRTATIWGERFARGYGSPDFLASRSQVEWDDGAPVSEAERETIIRVILDSARRRGQDVEIQ